MPHTHGQAKRKTPAQATPAAPAPARRRASQRLQEPPAPAVRGADGPEELPPPLPAPALREDLPEHETLLPPPPAAPYSLPAPPEVDDPGLARPLTPQPAVLSPALAEELTALWPDLQALAYWWRARPQLAQQDEAPERTLVRQTYPIEQRFIEAVQREADQTGESDAVVVNRALARYFASR